MKNKLAFRILLVPHSLSSQVLNSKYGGWRALLSDQPCYRPSVLWRDLQSIQRFLRKGVRWKIRNGTETLFWRDCWVREVPLLSLVISQPPTDLLDCTVREFWQEDHGWDFTCLREWLPAAILQDLRGIHLTAAESSETDVCLWSPGINGRFSLSSAKLLIRHPQVSTPSSIWRRLWKFKGPARASFTLWAAARDLLPTRSFLWRRRILSDASCCWCSAAFQTGLHILRDCPPATAVWRLLVPARCWQAFLSSTDSLSWIHYNLLCHTPGSVGLRHWPYIFRQIVHSIWLYHNRRVHDRSLQPNPYAVAISGLRTVVGTLFAFSNG